MIWFGLVIKQIYAYGRGKVVVAFLLIECPSRPARYLLISFPFKNSETRIMAFGIQIQDIYMMAFQLGSLISRLSIPSTSQTETSGTHFQTHV